MSALLISMMLLQAVAPPPPPASLPPGARPTIITNPDWAARPNGADFAALYPKAAMANGVEGFATLECGVSAEGLLANCKVIAQSQPDEGFGGAVLAMAPLFRMRPMARDGRPVAGGTVRIPVRFALPHEAPEDAGLSPPVNQPHWLRTPSGEDVARAYPRRARASGVVGKVSLRCVIGAEGRFDTCDVVEESPAGLGFGAAALNLSRLFRLDPLDGDGSRVAGRAIRLPISFVPPVQP